MPRKFVIALLWSFLISGGCTLLLGRKLMHSSQHKEPTVRYATAKKAIDAGAIIKPEELTFMDWPAAKPVEGAFTKAEEIAGRSTVYPIGSGQMVLDKYLAAPGAGIGLTTKIAEGMRAVALKSDDVVGVAGFLFPGSRVDVMVTYHAYQNPEPVTTTVVQDAQVAAVGHQIQPNTDGKAATVNVVTVLVKPEDAEKLVLAATQGSVYFVLRNGGDHAQAPGGAVQLSELTRDNSAKPVAQRAHKTTVPRQNTYTVETVLGDKESSTRFN